MYVYSTCAIVCIICIKPIENTVPENEVVPTFYCTAYFQNMFGTSTTYTYIIHKYNTDIQIHIHFVFSLLNHSVNVNSNLEFTLEQHLINFLNMFLKESTSKWDVKRRISLFIDNCQIFKLSILTANGTVKKRAHAAKLFAH